MSIAARVYECPYRGGTTGSVYRCDACGKDLIDVAPTTGEGSA